MGKEDDVADGRRVGEQHDQAVNADTLACGSGHPVFQGPNKILIHLGVNLFIIAFFRNLLFQALALINGVAELAECIGDLAAGDEELKAVGHGRVLFIAAGQRRHLDGIGGDKGGVDQFLFHQQLKEGSLGLAGTGQGLKLHPFCGTGQGQDLVIVFQDLRVNAADLDQSLVHGQTPPGGSKINFCALILDLHALVYLLRQPGDQLFGDVHHVVVGGIGLVEFEHSELRIVPGGQSFVAEVAVDLKDPFKAAYQQSFQVEFRGDAQVEIHAQRVMMGHERFGLGAAGDRLHHGGLHLHEATVAQEFTDQADDFHPFAEDVPAFRGDDQVNIALAIAGLDIGQAVPFLGQGTQGFGDHDQLVGHDRELIGLGLEQLAFNADNIADIPFLEGGKLLFAHGVLFNIDLDLARVIG